MKKTLVNTKNGARTTVEVRRDDNSLSAADWLYDCWPPTRQEKIARRLATPDERLDLDALKWETVAEANARFFDCCL